MGRLKFKFSICVLVSLSSPQQAFFKKFTTHGKMTEASHIKKKYNRKVIQYINHIRHGNINSTGVISGTET